MATKEKVVPVEWTGSAEQVAEARMTREVDDLSYGQLAELYGFPDGAAMREALEHRPEPRSKLEAMVQEVEARAQAERDLYKGIEGEVRNAQGDRELTTEEVDQIEAIYTSGAAVRFKEIAAAVEPPVHWLTVQNALGARGWVTPHYQMIPYSTGTPEGRKRLAADRQAGRISPEVYTGGTEMTDVNAMESIRI